MGLNQLWVSVVMLLFLQGARWCDCCWEDERIALLKLKAYFNYPNGNAMSSWEKIPNCCYWEYVACSPITRRVTSLYPWRDGRLGDWYLNTSFFLPFKELNDLSLEQINILGCVKNEGFERLWSLGNLESLDLSFNKFNNSILPSLSGLSSLKSLTLDNNRLKGKINIQGEFHFLPSFSKVKSYSSKHLCISFYHCFCVELNNLTSLKELNLQGNEIEGLKSSHGLRNLELLDLSYNRLNNSMLSSLKRLSSLKSLNLEYNLLEGKLNVEELGALSNLEELHLSGNQIIKFEALRGLSKLRKLILNNMTTNERSPSLLHSLGAFPYLKTLYLQYNNFHEKIFAQESENFTNLEELFLDSSSLNEESLTSLGALPSLKLLSLGSLRDNLPHQGLPSFKKLEHLHLDFSTIKNNVLHTISKMISLKTLSLVYCGLSGTIPATQGICELKHLQMLDVSYNDLSGTLPWCLANLTSLQRLYLISNHFTGKIFPVGGLTSIQELKLSGNHFQIPISLSPFFNHTRLKHLQGEDNEVYTELEVHNLIPKFQLETLVLPCLGYGGAFPKFLYHQHNLRVVDLSHIKMKGGFPFWLLDNNTNLEELSLANNSLSGPLQLPSHLHMRLSNLDISNNGFHGHIPMAIGASFPMLLNLKMSRNGFSGSIPSSLSNISFLEVLQLDGNRFSGCIPDNLYKCSYLEMLDVSDNHLSCRIPGSMSNVSSLKVLDLSRNNIFGSLPSYINPSSLVLVYLSYNRLQGSIKNAFYGCSDLITLDLGHNFLTGTIPEMIGSLSMLGYLFLSYNNLEGEIPKHLCNLDLLRLIDLSHNNFSGQILPCLRCTGGSGVIDPETDDDRQPLDFTIKWSTYSYQGKILSMFSGIDLSHNKLSGEIPPEIGALSGIQVLNLSHNNLTGPIPPTFSNLSEIESLDLSYNNLDGKIPPQLIQLTSLAVFSVANNNLSGSTPKRVAQFATFDESSYEGNPFLCGLPLSMSCSAAISPSPSPRVSTVDEAESGFIDMDVFYVSFVVAYIIILLTIAAVLWINPYWRQAWFYFIEVSFTKCQYFLEDNVYVLFKFRV
ncbi:cuscuta receptor 1 isoform X2 [Hevea brasiliensis]|uniref:cuscuta receptor 1 isoform X2 n=1 Tax=Hevea brasiliensis TaxID=3981 RepID=UPI0025FD53A8|nr:cuscuta receptor 1 isoform X2 [Hevea brasiliensis]